MSKKAQGLSMNVIIIAALALLVLVILAIIFMGRMSKANKDIDTCKGDCVNSAEDCSGEYQRTTSEKCYDIGSSEPNDKVCCMSI